MERSLAAEEEKVGEASEESLSCSENGEAESSLYSDVSNDEPPSSHIFVIESDDLFQKQEDAQQQHPREESLSKQWKCQKVLSY